MTASRRILGCLLAAAALIALSASDARAATACSYRQYKLEGPHLIPNTYSYLYVFDSDTLPPLQPGTNIPYKKGKFEARLQSGGRTWQFGRNRCRFAQVGGVDIESQGEAVPGEHAGDKDGVSVIDLGSMVNLDGVCASSGLIACTEWWSQGDELTEADIRFDVKRRWWAGLRSVPSSAQGPNGEVYDLWSVAAHEMGHAIGIDHVSTDPHAPAEVQAQVMYFQIDPGQTKRYLMGSDYRAMCFMYPCE